MWNLLQCGVRQLDPEATRLNLCFQVLNALASLPTGKRTIKYIPVEKSGSAINSLFSFIDSWARCLQYLFLFRMR